MTCAHFGTCGGCSLQHLTYAAQLDRRTRRFSQAIGQPVPPMIGMPVERDAMPWGFRQKVSFVFGSGPRDSLVMGHYARGSKRIIPIRECPVHSPRANRIAFALRDRLAQAGIRAAGARAGILRHLIVRTTRDDREAVAMLVVTSNDKALRSPIRGLLASADRPEGFFINVNERPGPFMVGERTLKIDGVGHVRENDIGPAFLISPTAFFQTNVAAAAHLVRLVANALASARRVLDLFSGGGLFSIALASRGAQVVSVEENRQASKDADANRRLNRIPEERLRLICSTVQDALPRLLREPFDAVVLDPPREGCGHAVLSAVFSHLAPRQVVYVSCNPDALAEELPAIAGAGYDLVNAQTVDMFPHTDHIEAVVEFRAEIAPRHDARLGDANSMNPFTKSVVIVSTLIAAAVEINSATYGFDPLLYLSAGGFVLAWLIGTRLHGLVSRVVLFFVYLSPALIMQWAGRDHTSYEMAWIGPLLGLVLAGRGAWSWHIPRPWLLPLVLWALVVSVSAPIVMLREVGFAPWIFNLARVSNTSMGISPFESISWVAYVVLGHNVGLLWFDWLHRSYAADRESFASEILTPLAAGVTVACVVGAYQGFVDLTFFSGHLWPRMSRAAGTLMDANAFGMIAALWGPAFVAFSQTMRRPVSVIVGAGGLALAFVGVYSSGSRTALIALTIGMVGVLFQGWRSVTSSESQSRPLSKRLLPVGIALVAGVTLIVLVARGSSTASIVARGSLGFVPVIGDLGPQEVWRQLTDRFGYGKAAALMIREHWLSGIGVGSFHTLVHDYAGALKMVLVPDNAQNWFRQQVAELGVIGSLACFAWCLLFLRALVARARDARFSPSAWVLRGSLIAFGIVSLVGVAGQSTAVVITFWTFAFWYLSVLEWPSELDPGRPQIVGKPAWALVLLVVAVHAATTYASARGDLLPQNRAKRFGWYYRYGLHDLERSPNGGRGRLWTMKKSLAVIPVEGMVLKFVCWIDHPDTDPVTVKVWADGRLVLSTELRKGENAAIDIPATADERRMIIETSVSRTFRPSDHGLNDTRELGLAMADWLWE